MFHFTLHLGLESLIPTMLYIGVWVAMLVSAFGRPRVGLYFLIPLLPLQTVRYRLHEFPLGANMVDIVLLGVVIGLRREGYFRFSQTGFGKVLAAFFVLTYIGLWKGSMFLDVELPLTFSDARLQDWKNYMVMPFLFFVVAAAFRERKHMERLLWLMCLSVVMLDKYYMGTVSGRDFSQFSYDVRYAGAMGYAGVNGFAAFEAQFSALLIALASFEKRLHIKLGYLALIALNLYCLLFSLSRGGYAAALVGILFLGLFRNRLLLVPLVLFLVTWQTIVPEAVRERVFMTKDAETGEIDTSAGDRLSLWQDALGIFVRNPVIGTGFNTYGYMHRLGYGDTHNYYLKLLVETGVTGLCLFLWLIARMTRAGWKLWRTASDPFLASLGCGFTALMVCLVVANMFGDRWTFLQVSGYTWTLLALVVSGLRITQEQEESEAEPQAAGFEPAPARLTGAVHVA